MEQACENFKVDILQIQNLYELVLKEIANKSNQKIYKELYNKSYLLEMNKEEEKLKKERNKVNSAVATVLGSNYWRIEGVKSIYTAFYKDISEVFGRDLDEFDVPSDESEIEIVEESSLEITPEKKKIEETIKIIEEIDEEELPQLISEEAEETFENVQKVEEFVNVIKPIRNEEKKIAKTLEKEEYKREKIDKLSDIVQEEKAHKQNSAIVENFEEASFIKIQKEIFEDSNKEEVVDKIVEEIKPKRKRKDIIKEEEEKKKASKIRETAKREKIEKVKAIEELEENDFSNKIEETEFINDFNKTENIIEEVEEIRPKRRRKDIIKEEEEKKKGKIKTAEQTRKKKKDEIQYIENKQEANEDSFEETEMFEKDSVEDFSNIEESFSEEPTMYDLDDDESLFGNVKSTISTRRNNLDLEMLEQLEEKNKSNKKGIFSSLMNMNSKKGKRVAN